MRGAESVDTVDTALEVIAHYRRPDLEARLRQTAGRLRTDRVRVLVVGEFKQGKSLLVNGLVKAPVCPVFDDVATSVPTVVRYAAEPSAALVRVVEQSDDGDPAAAKVARVEVPIEELAGHLCETGNPGNRERWRNADIGLPRALLAGGLEIVDTPGVGGLSSVHGAATMAELPSADAVLFVSDASQEYTAPELEFLKQATAMCPNVLCVLSKADLYPEWQRIAELDRRHLAGAGVEADLLVVSSALRVHAVKHNDEEADRESGFGELVEYLRERVVGQAELLARRSTAHDVVAVTEQLATTLLAEQAGLTDPDAAAEVIRRLTEAKQQAVALKERSARWQHTLSDGVADLNADIDYDLRDRMRDIVREAEEEVSRGGDPRRTWDQLAAWVEQEVSAAVAANFLWTAQRARWLAGQVAEHFSGDQELLPRIRTDAEDPLERVSAMDLRIGEPFGIGQKALSGLRGGYVGVLMFGMLGTLVGMPLINPFSVGAGLLLSGKGFTDERRRVYTKRQVDAKAAVRRYADDVIFQAGKDSRELLRRVQRDLRDYYTDRAEETNRSLKESLASAERSVRSSKEERERRLAEIPAELRRLGDLRDRALALTPGGRRVLEAAS
ncbi:dynamin family protein [Actinophytocola oryzae]|uniref:Dynamin family protein n=1 Tax=Actinophytocola oryzae TaxID=502181 RepID=A0A4R7VFC0_9PSEU|nr:dynamin family protein [Actinophytocola oryzae]TDV47787.1 dynamin family protein [Actinophytocola oryzae]